PHRFGAAEIAVLFEQRHAQPGAPSDLPARRLHLPSQQAKERRFSGAIAPDDSPSFASFDREGNLSEERSRTELHADASRGQFAHLAVQAFQSCSASPTVSALPFRTSGIRSNRGSSTSLSNMRSSVSLAWRRPSSV